MMRPRRPKARAGGWATRRFAALPWRIGDDEIRAFRSFLIEHSRLRFKDEVAEQYRIQGLEVVTDALGPRVPQLISDALTARRPFSVIRIGDGEGIILTFGIYPDTPALDDWAVAKIASAHGRIRLKDPRHNELRSMMRASILSADVIGVPGLWHAHAAPDATSDEWVEAVMGVGAKDVTIGAVGYWRAIDQMLALAREAQLDGGTIAAAHLHLGVLKHLDRIVPSASAVLCITNRPTAVDAIRQAFPEVEVDMLDAGTVQRPGRVGKMVSLFTRRESADSYFAGTTDQFDIDLAGTLVLVGAGPWSEYYCGRIKERGGVAVDFGSAFDLLAGICSRPVHAKIDIDDLLASVRLATADE